MTKVMEAPAPKDVPCSFCGATVVGTPFVSCASCDVPAHRDCWTSNGKCSAFACGSVDALDPAIRIYRQSPATALQVVAPPALPAAGGSRLELKARRTRLAAIYAQARRDRRPYDKAMFWSLFGGMSLFMAGVIYDYALLSAAGMLGLVLGVMACGFLSHKLAHRLRVTQQEIDRIDLLVDELDHTDG